MSAMTGRHVLIVQDAAPTMQPLCNILRGAGYRPTIRDSAVGQAAISALRPDLILLDPSADASAAGIDLLRRLRADSRTAAIPVVLCSASVEAVRRLDGDVIGPGLGLVMHPVDRDELLAEIVHALERSAVPEAGARRKARGASPVLV